MKKLVLGIFLVAALGAFNFGDETTTTCSALTGTYASKNTIGPYTRSIVIQNTCNEDVLLSIDGSTDGMTLMAGVSAVFEYKDFPHNDSNPDKTLYVKHAGSAPTSGTLIITVHE